MPSGGVYRSRSRRWARSFFQLLDAGQVRRCWLRFYLRSWLRSLSFEVSARFFGWCLMRVLLFFLWKSSSSFGFCSFIRARCPTLIAVFRNRRENCTGLTPVLLANQALNDLTHGQGSGFKSSTLTQFTPTSIALLRRRSSSVTRVSPILLAVCR